MNGYMLSGIVNGLSNGIQLGQQIRGALDQAQVRSVMADGIEATKKDRAADIEANSQVGSKANADNTMTMPTYDDARGNSYADADTQKAAAEKNAPSLDELYMKNVVPKVKEAYIAQGNMAAADKWDDWMQEKNTRLALGHLSKATIAGQMGDFKGAADNMVKTYNTPGYLEDGIHAEGYELIKDKDGNTTGMTLKMKNKASGEVFTQNINGTQDILNMGLAALDPRKAFEHRLAQDAAATANQYKVAFEGVKNQYGMVRDNNKAVVKAAADSALEDKKSGNAMERVVTGKELDGANKVKVAEIRAAAGELFKKGASPQEAHRMLVQGMNGKFVDYNGKPTMTPEEMSQRATEMVEATYGAGALSQPQGRPPANTLSAGLPGANPQAQATPVKGAVRYDTKTGQLLPY